MGVLASQDHYGIFKTSFRIPLNSTVFPKLKFKIENHERSSIKLKHRLFSKYIIVNCSFSIQ